jgi:hypothetical protein
VFRVRPAGTLSNTHDWCRAGVSPQSDTLQDPPVSLIEPCLP